MNVYKQRFINEKSFICMDFSENIYFLIQNLDTFEMIDEII